MAQVDSRIALGVQPVDVGAAIGRGYQLRDLAAQADARKLDNQLKQQSLKKQATLGDLYRAAMAPDGSYDRKKIMSGMASAGYGADLPELQKSWWEHDKNQADYQHKMIETGIKANDYVTKTVGGLLQKPSASPDDVYSAIDHLRTIGVLPQDMAESYKAQVPTNPMQLQGWLKTMLVQSLDKKDQFTAMMPNVQAQNLGGHTQMVDTNPLTNPGVVGQQFQQTPTIGELESQRHNRVTEAQQAERNRADGAKAPPGYRFTANGNLEAIPGGPADEKATMAGKKAEQRKQAALVQTDRMIQATNDALKLVDKSLTTGIPGAVAAKIPGTDASDLQATLETIKANLGFAELQAMREASPTGGALGSVAVQELNSLQSTVANLSPNQSADQLRVNLKKIAHHQQNMRAILAGDMPGGYDSEGQSWGTLAQEYEKQGMPRQVIRQVLQSQGLDPEVWGY